MPKLKNHSGSKKRFFRTASGKFKHKTAGLMHLLTPMSAKRGRNLRKAGYLNATEGETMRKFLPYK